MQTETWPGAREAEGAALGWVGRASRGFPREPRASCDPLDVFFITYLTVNNKDENWKLNDIMLHNLYSVRNNTLYREP